MSQVKICGLSDITHVRVAAEAGADWVGFVLFPKSPRNVLGSGESALEDFQDLVRAAADFGINSVALMVDPNDDLFHDVALDIQPDAIQLHGAETVAQIDRMWRDCGGEIELWKAFSVDAETDLSALDIWSVDRLLLDAKPPAESDLPGGNGATFDWQLLQDLHLAKPWILAGGLTIENVSAAIDATGAPMVDVSSGVETAPGVKDEELIRAFIDAAKSV